MKAIPFARAALGGAELRAATRVIKSGWLTSGRECARFEEKFAQLSALPAGAGGGVGGGGSGGASGASGETPGSSSRARVPTGIAVSSATAGLHVSLAALGCGEGDYLFVSPYTFTASAAVGLYAGMNLCFVDIGGEGGGGYNIDPGMLRKAVKGVRDRVGSAPKCVIMAVHIGGVPCDMGAITQVARDYSCVVVEDAAHAQPLRGEGGALGVRGDCVVFSHYATKPICAGEGGMIITHSAQTAADILQIRDHGMDRTLWQRTGSAQGGADSKAGRAWWDYDIVSLGYKYNLADINAAIGYEQLCRAEKYYRRRLAISEYYREKLGKCGWLTLPAANPLSSWHLFPVRVNTSHKKRDELIGYLTERGIGVSVHYRPLHTTTFYQKHCGVRDGDFPNALSRWQESLSLPIYPGLSNKQLARITATLLSV